MRNRKILFIDRDGTLIDEPADKQVDSIAKLYLKPDIITALLQLQKIGYELVMVTNQDKLGTDSFPTENFVQPQAMLITILKSQGIEFSAIHVCPHTLEDKCWCRKPNLGLVTSYLNDPTIDFDSCFVIGDRQTDIELAANMNIRGIRFNDETMPWRAIVNEICISRRQAQIARKTHETEIAIKVDLDNTEGSKINTGIGFFDHMLEQLAKHGNFYLSLEAKGDLHVDEHHMIEDTAIVLGQALKKALNNKLGIQRYGFLLPMDDALAQVAIDLSGRSFFAFDGKLVSPHVGTFPTEMVPHFFRSLAENLAATLHIKVTGENTHHMIESMFKAVGRCLRMAFERNGSELPTTKGAL